VVGECILIGMPCFGVEESWITAISPLLRGVGVWRGVDIGEEDVGDEVDIESSDRSGSVGCQTDNVTNMNEFKAMYDDVGINHLEQMMLQYRLRVQQAAFQAKSTD